MYGLDHVTVALWFLPVTLFLLLPSILVSVQGVISAFTWLMPSEGSKNEYATAGVRGG